jgi:hypothetical protein
MTGEVDPNDPRWALVNEVVQSPIFEKSQRLRSFLLYVCELELNGQRQEINEQNIGTHVFGRPENYNPGDDSIVRSQARFLRQRLGEYFSTAGSDSPLRIEIPKGSYVPVFEKQLAKPLAVAAADEIEKPVNPQRHSISRVLIGLFCLVGLILVSSLSYWLYSRNSPESRFWNALFDPYRMQVIVPADSTLILFEELSGREVSFESYVNGSYLSTPDQPKDTSNLPLSELARSHYTSMADLGLVARLVRVRQVEHATVEIRNARELSMSDARERDLVLIGGSRANPWVNLFAQRMNFRVDFDSATRQNRVTNKAPLKGESTFYAEDAGEHRLVYGLVAFEPSLDQQGHSLLLAGTSSAGTQAAADFLLNSKLLAGFLNKIQRQDGSIPHFEVLLGNPAVNGNAADSTIVAYRLTP